VALIDQTDIQMTASNGHIVISIPAAALANCTSAAKEGDAEQLEGRNTFRVAVRDWMKLDSQLKDGQQAYDVDLRDISLGGFEILRPQDDRLLLPTNRPLYLKMQSAGHSVELACLPVRIDGDSIAFRFGSHYTSDPISPPRGLEQIIMELQRQWVSHNGYSNHDMNHA
jgi:hypothetical protein